MQFILTTEKGLDGIDASIPSIRECEVWAATEDDAITKLLDRLAFFLNRKPGFKHTLDILRREEGKIFYTLNVKDRA